LRKIWTGFVVAHGSSRIGGALSRLEIARIGSNENMLRLSETMLHLRFDAYLNAISITHFGNQDL
jgi:hypothetical protein